MKITLAQINPTVGALRDNCAKIKEIIDAYSSKSDIIVFPEMVLTGYPPQDLLLDHSFVNNAGNLLDELANSSRDTPVVIGTIRQSESKLYNTAAVIQNGKIQAYRDKTHLPNYDVFDEHRYFTPAKLINPVELIINNKLYKLGIQICEDLWDADYELKVSKKLYDQGADLIINISASPYHIDRIMERTDMIKEKCKELKLYFIYCNLIGAQDELVFDGQSCIINSQGDMVALCSDFKEHIQVVDLDNIKPLCKPDVCEEEQIYKALSLGVQDYFTKSGHSKAVIGLSGGIDSALTAAIAKNAIGANNVLGFAMPSQFSSNHSIDDARNLAHNLGIKFEIISIKEINHKMLEDLSPIFNGSKTGLAEENLQARIRGNILMSVANKKQALLLNTGNKTETALGYCTMYGDMAGALAVISDLNKSQVYAIANWLNNHMDEEIIPYNSISKPPSAELRPEQVDPFDYDIVSPLVDILINEPGKASELEKEGYDYELIEDLLKKIRFSEYKRRQAPPGIRVSSKAFGLGRRYPIINAYAVYK